MRLALGAALAATLAASVPAQADVQEKEFLVVGTWGNLFNWKEHESRMWQKVLPEASGGKLTANAKPYTELGLSGYEVVKQLEVGAYDAVHALTTYTSQDSPPLEGIDLAGVFQDFATYRKALNAYKPVIQRELRDKYNAELVMLYTFPSQQLYCKLGEGEDGHLAGLAGKKIRTYSTSLADFIEGLGASSVTIAFSEAVPALEKGVATCGACSATSTDARRRTESRSRARTSCASSARTTPTGRAGARTGERSAARTACRTGSTGSAGSSRRSSAERRRLASGPRPKGACAALASRSCAAAPRRPSRPSASRTRSSDSRNGSAGSSSCVTASSSPGTRS